MAASGNVAFADSDGDDDVISDINIIPFVDIVLVLLIIFMVTSTAIVRSALKVDLPRAAHAGDLVDSTLNVVFTAEGALTLDGVQTDRAGLQEGVRAAVLREPKTQAVISADKELGYGSVIEIIDLVKGAGVKTFALNIERGPPNDGDEVGR